jgi:hypothetical protein
VGGDHFRDSVRQGQTAAAVVLFVTGRAEQISCMMSPGERWREAVFLRR